MWLLLLLLFSLLPSCAIFFYLSAYECIYIYISVCVCVCARESLFAVSPVCRVIFSNENLVKNK